MQLAYLLLVTVLVTVDNALLCGVLIRDTSKRMQCGIALVVASALGATQGLMAIGIGSLLQNEMFRMVCAAILVWMCWRTISEHGKRSYVHALKAALWVLILTALGSVGNVLWLGTAHQGHYMALILLSVCSIPLFVSLALFFAKQAERYDWFLYLGAGMMAWIAASLFLKTSVGQNITPALPGLLIQALTAIFIMTAALTLGRRTNQPR